MPYADVTRVRKLLTEKGQVEDSKVNLYCQMADNHINADLINLQSVLVIPIPNPSIVMVDIATALAVAYFYKFESGDTITATQAENEWTRFFQASYRRPQFFVTTGEDGGAPYGVNYAGPSFDTHQ